MITDDELGLPEHPAEEVVVVPLPEFEKFPKIPRYFRTVQITEKVDGTNAQIIIPDDQTLPIVVGSRNRWITPGKKTDNFGFAEFVQANATSLRRLGPGRHYGEWYGCGIGRGYGITERRLALFDVGRYKAGELPLPEGLPANVGLVPVLATRELSVTEDVVGQVLADLKATGSKMVPGYMNPEGIVIKVMVNRTLYKFTLDGDAKGHPSPEEG